MKSNRNHSGNLYYFVLIFFVLSVNVQAQSYLGQTPPKNTPIKFNPVNYIPNSEWVWADSPTFSPDGNEMYFTKYFTSKDSHEIWYTKIVNGIWQAPQKVSFTKTADDSYPTFVGGNDTLVYKSRYYDGGPLYRVTRTSTGWSEPEKIIIPLPINTRIIGFKIAKSGNLYLSLMRTDFPSFQENYKYGDIYICNKKNGVYSQPINLGDAINSTAGDGISYIDPEEKFMLIESLRSGGLGYHDLYISKKNQDGIWEKAVSLNSTINGWHEDAHAKITPDGKYLFFTSLKTGDTYYTPYWVDAKFISDMVTGVNEEAEVKLPTNIKLNQNYPNPFNPSTTISYSITENKPVDVKIKVMDLLGKEVAVLVNKQQSSGEYQVKFDGCNLTSGVYFYELNVEGLRKAVRKMNLIK